MLTDFEDAPCFLVQISKFANFFPLKETPTFSVFLDKDHLPRQYIISRDKTFDIE